MPFSARDLKKNIFFDVDIVVKKANQDVVYRSLYSYRQRVRVISRFPNIFFVFVPLRKRPKRQLRRKNRIYSTIQFDLKNKDKEITLARGLICVLNKQKINATELAQQLKLVS